MTGTDPFTSAIATAVVAAVEPLRAEVARLTSEVAALRASTPAERLASPAVAARYMHVSTATLRRWIRDGTIPRAAVHQGGRGRAIRIDLAALRPPSDDEVARAAGRACDLTRLG